MNNRKAKALRRAAGLKSNVKCEYHEGVPNFLSRKAVVMKGTSATLVRKSGVRADRIVDDPVVAKNMYMRDMKDGDVLVIPNGTVTCTDEMFKRYKKAKHAAKNH